MNGAFKFLSARAMTAGLFTLVAVLVVAGAGAAYFAGASKLIGKFYSGDGGIPAPLVGTIGILFGLFIGFSSSDINQRTSALRLATEREINAAYSILNITSGIGPTADPVRNAVLEYLIVVTTTEREWLAGGAIGEAPGDVPVYTVVLNAAVFVEHSQAAEVVKDRLLARADDLTNARVERLARVKRNDDISLWISLAIMAGATQFAGAFALAGKRRHLLTFLGCYTLVAIAGLFYLAWADRLIGPSRIGEQAKLFQTVLDRALSVH